MNTIKKFVALTRYYAAMVFACIEIDVELFLIDHEMINPTSTDFCISVMNRCLRLSRLAASANKMIDYVEFRAGYDVLAEKLKVLA